MSSICGTFRMEKGNVLNLFVTFIVCLSVSQGSMNMAPECLRETDQTYFTMAASTPHSYSIMKVE